MRSTEPSIFLIALGATMLAVLFHEGAHFLATRVVAGYWPEFVFSGVRYPRPLAPEHVGWVFVAGPIMDVVLTTAFAWLVWVRRYALTTEFLSLAIGATLVFVVTGVAVLISGRPEADLVKLQTVEFGGHRPDALEVYLLYFAALLLPYAFGIGVYRRYAKSGLLRWSQVGFLVLGSICGFGLSLTVREVLVAV